MNRLFTAWTENVYHRRVHSETGAAPLARWMNGHPLTLPNPADLAEAFRWSEHRTVSKTALVSLHGKGYGTQCWNISTPDGHTAARFPCLTRPDAEAAAARISAALPGGAWPADADTRALLPLALQASSTPDMLPLRHRDKPNWGSGLGGDMVDFHVPDSRADYEKMIAAHGRIPKACQACARTVREQKKLGWGPRTNHWPRWSVSGHRGAYARAHCYCASCMGLDLRIGAFGAATDHDGNTVPGSAAVSPWSDPRAVVQASVDLDRSDRPFAWFTYFLKEAGHVVVDERRCVNLWPVGVRHDDALFCETGVTSPFDLAD